MLCLLTSLYICISTIMSQKCIITDEDGMVGAYDTRNCINKVYDNIDENQEFYVKTSNEGIIALIHLDIIDGKGIKLSNDIATIRAIKAFAETTYVITRLCALSNLRSP